MGYMIAYLVLTALGVGVVVAKDGQPQPPYSVGKTLIGLLFTWTLLYMGGAFNVFFN